MTPDELAEIELHIAASENIDDGIVAAFAATPTVPQPAARPSANWFPALCGLLAALVVLVLWLCA